MGRRTWCLCIPTRKKRELWNERGGEEKEAAVWDPSGCLQQLHRFWDFASSRGRVRKGWRQGTKRAEPQSRVGSTGRKFMGCVEIREGRPGWEGREMGWREEAAALL